MYDPRVAGDTVINVKRHEEPGQPVRRNRLFGFRRMVTGHTIEGFGEAYSMDSWLAA